MDVCYRAMRRILEGANAFADGQDCECGESVLYNTASTMPDPCYRVKLFLSTYCRIHEYDNAFITSANHVVIPSKAFVKVIRNHRELCALTRLLMQVKKPKPLQEGNRRREIIIIRLRGMVPFLGTSDSY